MTFSYIFLALGLTICTGVLTGVVANWLSHRDDVRQMQRWEAELEAREHEVTVQNGLLNDRRAVQLNIDNELRVREEAVAELGRRTRQTAETLRAEQTHFDTMVTTMDWDDLPHPGENDDTREIPRIED